ncbi:MAG: EVE domain-containing protein [Vampirovibrionales bacterium]|nr:EVE domain-containing protein [Vampirovibrionales bacterium]
MTQYWVTVGSQDNFERSRELGFTLHGFKTRAHKKASHIQAGDKLLYYLTGLSVIAGAATITSPMREDRSFVWPCTSNDPYPWRVDIKPDWIPDDATGFLPIKPYTSKLEYLKKWAPERWSLGFQGNLHQWPQADYDVIRVALTTLAPVSV